MEACLEEQEEEESKVLRNDPSVCRFNQLEIGLAGST